MYELWHTASGNRLATFRSEEAALQRVRTIVRTDGVEMVDGLALGYYDKARKRTTRIASDAELADRAGRLSARQSVRPGGAAATKSTPRQKQLAG